MLSELDCTTYEDKEGGGVVREVGFHRGFFHHGVYGGVGGVFFFISMHESRCHAISRRAHLFRFIDF